MADKTRKEIGDEGEDLAASYLESKGYTVVDRNYFFERAEVDIVAMTDSEVVFVEVKTRSNLKYGKPEESITEKKRQSMYKAAQAWVYERKMDGAPARFDVISIYNPPGKAPDIKHFEHAFTFFG